MTAPSSSIVIRGMGSISPLGSSPESVWKAYQSTASRIASREFLGIPTPVAALDEQAECRLEELRREKEPYPRLDRTVAMAIFASREAVAQSGWSSSPDIGINIGSSRGATSLFESFHDFFLTHAHGRVPTLTSPLTTLGNVSSWVAQDLRTDGVSISHSVTCSTALHGLANAIAWLKSGMADRFIVGGTEAPLTAFTVAQMRALRIYSDRVDDPYPCRPLDADASRSSMVLGEGAAVFCVDRREESEGSPVLAVVEAVGYANEQISHSASLSDEGECLYHSMRMALEGLTAGKTIDAVVLHAPGTLQGDRAELTAVRTLFGDPIPLLVSNKWKIGHTLCASVALSMELAILMLQQRKCLTFPYPVLANGDPRELQTILVNASGFGGNAVSVILSRPGL
jgi:3-oxoacyl-(acyl-carrier-protein) synthase